MLGTQPSLIAFTYISTIISHVCPSRVWLFTLLGFTLFNTFFLRVMTYSTNSALSSSNSIFSRFWSSSSLVKGLIMVQHSLSLKNFFRHFLMSFFESLPFSWRALSRYSFEPISVPYSSHSCRAKSLTTHMNDGMQSISSSMFSSLCSEFSSYLADLN